MDIIRFNSDFIHVDHNLDVSRQESQLIINMCVYVHI